VYAIITPVEICLFASFFLPFFEEITKKGRELMRNKQEGGLEEGIEKGEERERERRKALNAMGTHVPHKLVLLGEFLFL
jgi:hypothetical protein